MDVEQLSYGVSLSPVILRFTLVFLWLLLGSAPVEGQYQVIGSPQPIVAAPGDDVVLPCHVEPPLSVTRMTVEWSRLDVQPDPEDQLRRVKYVHLYRERLEVPDMKIPSYIRRTALFTDDLIKGNISLKIINVTLADAGRFRCFLPKLKSKNQFSIVSLVVDPNAAETWTTETPLQPDPDLSEETDIKGDSSGRSRLTVVCCVVLMILMIISVGVTRYFTQRCRNQKMGTLGLQEGGLS